MALISLKVIGGRIVRSEKFGDEPRWFMIMEAKLSDPLTVTTGEALEDFQIEVGLEPISESIREFFREHGEGWEKAVGYISYGAAIPAGDGSPGHRALLSFMFYLGETDMTRLLDFARAGRFPRWIGTESEAWKYGDDPYGHGKKWDTSSGSLAPLTRIDFSIPIVDTKVDTKHEDQEEMSEPTPAVSTSDMVAELKNLLAGMTVWQKRTTYVLIGLGAVLLLRLMGI